MVKAVIFDLDDTLISERKYIESGYQYISTLLSDRYKMNENEIYQLLFELLNESPKNVFNRFFDNFSIPYTRDTIIDLVEQFRSHKPNISFFDDVIPCLNFLEKQNVKLGIITDGYSTAQRQKLNAVNAFDYFNEIIITDDLGREYWKPHSKPFELIKEKLNVRFEEMVYVGDNPEKDFYIGEILPIRTVRLNREGIYKDKSYFKNIKESFKLNNLIEFINLFHEHIHR
jgi:putative hydrolase of the HAD superfamily